MSPWCPILSPKTLTQSKQTAFYCSMAPPASCCYSQPCAILLPCLPVCSLPDFVPQKSCAAGLTDPGSTYCTNTELKFIGTLCSWALTQHWYISVTAALVPSSPTNLLEMSLLMFHLCTCCGSITQTPTNKPFTIHSYSAHEVPFHIPGIPLIPSLLWHDLVFQSGLSRARSWFW